MITVKVEGMDSVREALSGFGEASINKTMATALTRTASQVRDEIKRQLPVIFDRPTPYTMKALTFKKAEAADLVAEVAVNDQATGGATPQAKYLEPEVTGGSRRGKRFELALQKLGVLPVGWKVVPGAGARLDAYGNVSLGQIVQIMMQLRATMEPGYASAPGFNAGKAIRTQRKAGGQFFVLRQKAGRATPGIYQREFMGRNVTPVLLFVRDVRYYPRFDFAGIAMREAQTRLQANVEDAIAERIAKAR